MATAKQKKRPTPASAEREAAKETPRANHTPPRARTRTRAERRAEDDEKQKRKLLESRARQAERSTANKEAYSMVGTSGEQYREVLRSGASLDDLEAFTHLQSDEFEYTEQVDAALYRLVSTGHSLRNISMLPGAPPLSRLLRWVGDKSHPFNKTYSEAKNVLTTLYEEQIIENAVSPLLGEVRTRRSGTGEKGGTIDVEEVRTADNVQRAALIDGALKFTLGYLLPKKHGRNAQPSDGSPNDQLEALFSALKQGPAE